MIKVKRKGGKKMKVVRWKDPRDDSYVSSSD